MRRRFFLGCLIAAPVACIRAALAEDVIINVRLGTGDSAVYKLRAPQTLLDRGGSIDGLPVRSPSGAPAIVPWSGMRHVVFIPGDIPTVIITYRDRSQIMFDVEPCRLVAGDLNFDIHDVAEIELR